MPSRKTKVRYISINVDEAGFVSKIFGSKKEYNPEDVEILRKILSNEKARILYILKKEQPKSIYRVAKLLRRDFKSVYQDLKMLEKFGFIEFHSQKNGNRTSHIPVLTVDNMRIVIKI